jgi:hypothetical protein
MERLTERIKRPQKDDLIVYTNGKYEDTIPAEMTNDDIRAVLKKLADYEDLEEQGLLVRLPDDLNKVLYQVNYRWTECTEYGEENNKCEIYDCKCECDSRKEYYIAEVGLQYIQIVNYYDRLGKFLFLTREEAEKKLEDIQNDKT